MDPDEARGKRKLLSHRHGLERRAYNVRQNSEKPTAVEET